MNLQTERSNSGHISESYLRRSFHRVNHMWVKLISLEPPNLTVSLIAMRANIIPYPADFFEIVILESFVKPM